MCRVSLNGRFLLAEKWAHGLRLQRRGEAEMREKRKRIYGVDPLDPVVPGPHPPLYFPRWGYLSQLVPPPPLNKTSFYHLLRLQKPVLTLIVNVRANSYEMLLSGQAHFTHLPQSTFTTQPCGLGTPFTQMIERRELRNLTEVRHFVKVSQCAPLVEPVSMWHRHRLFSIL